MHQPHTQASQQSINHDQQPSITVMPSQMLSKSSHQPQRPNARDQRVNYTQYSNEVQKQKIKKNSSELNFYQKRLSQHQVSKQRTASNNSTSSYQKMPMVSGSSHSRHSQKRKEVVAGQPGVAKYSGHDQELSSSEKRLVNEHEASQ